MKKFSPWPKPDISIEWFTHIRDPLSWSLGTPPNSTFEYGEADLIARGFNGKDPVFVTEVGEEIVFRVKEDFRQTRLFPVFWEWSFGDGVREYGREVRHVYSMPSPEGIQVVLTVTDNKNRKWRAREQMYIQPESTRPVLVDWNDILVPAPPA